MARLRSIKLQGHDIHTGWLLCPHARNVRSAGVTRPPLVQVGEFLVEVDVLWWAEHCA